MYDPIHMLLELPTGNMVLKAVILIPFFSKPFITTMKKKSNSSNFNMTVHTLMGYL